MSAGGGVYRPNWKSQSLDQGDVNDFLNSSWGKGVSGAQDLTGVQSVNVLNNGKVVSSDFNNDLTDVYSSFLGYVKAKQADAQAHEEYVKAFQDKPGRTATLLTGLAANAEKRILGSTNFVPASPVNPNKTSILGG